MSNADADTLLGAGQSSLTTRIIDRWEDFLALRSAWERLLRRSPQCENPFLTHEWFQAWWEAFGRGQEMLILCLTSRDELVGIAPLMRGRFSYYGLPVRRLSVIANGHTNRADLIAHEHHGELVARVLTFALSHRRDWDMFELNFLPADSPTVAAVPEEAPRLGFTCATKPCYDSPFIPLDGDWQSFYGRRDGHFRRNMKNREKRLAALGSVEYEDCNGNRPLHDFLQEVFAVGDRSWKGAEKTAVASTPALRCFYTRLAELMHPKGWLSLHLLRVAGKPIAFHYSLKNNDTLYLLKTEYDMAYHTYAPGQQIQKRVLEASYGSRMRIFDFLGPDMTWKREWAEHVKPHVRLLLFHRGLRSRLLAFLECWAKPTLKRSALIQRLTGPAPHNGGTRATQE